MKPVFKIGNHDYAEYIEELVPARNDLDSGDSGRNLLNGLMYRNRITQKDTWTVKCLRLSEQTMLSLSTDLKPVYVQVTMLNPATNTVTTKSYYTATLSYGTQRYNKSKNIVYYEGCSFTLTER